MRRLEKSKYADNFVLKGGLFLYTLTEFDSRVTIDADFMLRRIPNTTEKLREIISEIIETDTTNDYVKFEIKGVSQISINKQYPGIHADIIARIKNTRTPFGIDFGIGDVIVPGVKKHIFPTQLNGFLAPTINTYSVESTVAEKLDAILLLMDFSSRMKDYYDVYYIANRFDFDGKTLTEALKKTFANRGRVYTVERFNQMTFFSSDDAMKKKWSAFCKKYDSENDFDVIIKTIRLFLLPVYQAALRDEEYSKTWTANEQKWK